MNAGFTCRLMRKADKEEEADAKAVDGADDNVDYTHKLLV